MIVKVARELDRKERLALEVSIASRLMSDAKKKRSKIAQAKLHDYIVNGITMVVVDGKE